MSDHPNAILLCIIKPKGLAINLSRKITAEYGKEKDKDYLKIGENEYNHDIMEYTYNESWQITAEKGDIIVFDMITYGFGKKIIWEKVQKQKEELEKWAKTVCEKYNASFEIFITANYW